jgi:hypothetical protein
MKSFILALLPGLEEETGEFFDKVRAKFGSADRLLYAEFAKGAQPVGSPLWHCVVFFLPSKHLVDNADYTVRSGNFLELPVTTTTPFKR